MSNAPQDDVLERLAAEADVSTVRAHLFTEDGRASLTVLGVSWIDDLLVLLDRCEAAGATVRALRCDSFDFEAKRHEYETAGWRIRADSKQAEPIIGDWPFINGTAVSWAEVDAKAGQSVFHTAAFDAIDWSGDADEAAITMRENRAWALQRAMQDRSTPLRMVVSWKDSPAAPVSTVELQGCRLTGREAVREGVRFTLGVARMRINGRAMRSEARRNR